MVDSIKQSSSFTGNLGSLLKTRFSGAVPHRFNESLHNSSFVYVYNITEVTLICPSLNSSQYLKILRQLHKTDYITRDPYKAGTFVVVLDGTFSASCRRLENLPHWNGGINHIVIAFTSDINSRDIGRTWWTALGEGVLAQPVFKEAGFREHKDIIIPTLPETFNFSSVDSYIGLPELVPVYRKHLITFSGTISNDLEPENSQFYLNLKNQTNVHVQLNCENGTLASGFREWSLCADRKTRKWSLGNATFSLIPNPKDIGQFSTVTFQLRLFEALKYGSIPVCFGDSLHLFPFAEILDWRRAALVVPHYIQPDQLINILSSYKETDLFELRRQGRILWLSYFSSHRAILETTLLVLRMRSSKRGAPPPSFPVNIWPNGTTSANKTVPPLRHIFQTDDLHRMGDHFHEHPATPFDAPSSPDLVAMGKPYRSVS